MQREMAVPGAVLRLYVPFRWSIAVAVLAVALTAFGFLTRFVGSNEFLTGSELSRRIRDAALVVGPLGLARVSLMLLRPAFEIRAGGFYSRRWMSWTKFDDIAHLRMTIVAPGSYLFRSIHGRGTRRAAARDEGTRQAVERLWVEMP